MAFEKMTTEELAVKLTGILKTHNFNRVLLGGDAFDVEKIGARAIKLTSQTTGKKLYFLWYDDDNWTLGTKLYRNRPQKYKGNVGGKGKTYTVNSRPSAD